MLRTLIAAVAVLALGLAGCSNFTSGQPVVKYEKGKSPLLLEAPITGTYALYSTFDNTPKLTVNLEQGDRLGFEAAQTGAIKVIAGERSWEMPDATYVWKRKP